MSMSITLDVQGLIASECRMMRHGQPHRFVTVEMATDNVKLNLYVDRDDVAGARALAGMLLAAALEVEAAAAATKQAWA